MNIAVGSAFRNSSYHLVRYFSQVVRLRDLMPGHSVRVIAAEGDSVDDTRQALQEYGSFVLPVQLLDVSHGGPWFGSTEAMERMVSLSRIGNAIFEAVTPSDDVLVYVESDLVWEPEVIVDLIAHAVERVQGFDIFSPLVFAGQCFYDIWGFRKNDVRFGPFEPFHSELNGGLTEVDSVGSCLVMRAEVARACRIRNDYCLVGWCEDARSQGYHIATDSKWRINHP